MSFRMGDSVKDYLVWPVGLSLNVSFLTSTQSEKFSFHDYLCAWSPWRVFARSLSHHPDVLFRSNLLSFISSFFSLPAL